MEDVFFAYADVIRKECSSRCPMEGIGGQYYLKNIEKLYTHEMPHAFTGCVDPECCSKRFEEDGWKGAVTSSQSVQRRQPILASFNKFPLITPSTPATPSTIHIRKAKNVVMQSTTLATRSAPINVTNVSAQHFESSLHGRATLQKLPYYIARMLDLENNNALGTIKLRVGDNSDVQCLYNDCGQNIVRGSLMEENITTTMLPTAENCAEQAKFVDEIDDTREDDPAIAAMLEANMPGNLGPLDLENCEQYEDENLLEAFEEIFRLRPIELRDDDNSYVQCFYDDRAENCYRQFFEDEKDVIHPPPTVEDGADELILVEEIVDPREEDAVVLYMLGRKTSGNVDKLTEDYETDSNRTLPADNQEHVLQPIENNAQPMETASVPAVTNSASSERVRLSMRPIEKHDVDNSYFQSLNNDGVENINRQFVNADKDINNPPITLENFDILEEIDYEDYELDSNEQAEHNEQPMETSCISVVKNSADLRELEEDGETSSSEDIYVISPTSVQSLCTDDGESIYLESLEDDEDDEDTSISSPTVEDFADEDSFVEEVDDPREEVPVVSKMMERNAFGSFGALNAAHEADNNKPLSAEIQEHVLQPVEQDAQPIITPCEPVLENRGCKDPENCVMLEKDANRSRATEDIYSLPIIELLDDDDIYILSFDNDDGENITRQILEDEEDITSPPPMVMDFADEVIYVEEVNDPREEDPVVEAMLRTNTSGSIDELIEDNGAYPAENHQEHVLQLREHNIPFLGMLLKIPSVPVLTTSRKSEGTSRRKQLLKPLLMNFGDIREPLKQIENQEAATQLCLSNSANRGRKGRVSKRYKQTRTVPYRKNISSKKSVKRSLPSSRIIDVI